MPREVSAGAIIFRKEGNLNYYLLLHYTSGHWEFPKGHIEKGENEIETVKREIAEETGLKDIKIIDGFKERIKYFFKNNYNLEGEEKKKYVGIINFLGASCGIYNEIWKNYTKTRDRKQD